MNELNININVTLFFHLLVYLLFDAASFEIIRGTYRIADDGAFGDTSFILWNFQEISVKRHNFLYNFIAIRTTSHISRVHTHSVYSARSSNIYITNTIIIRCEVCRL